MTTTQQPDWKLIANLGDVNPLEYDGYFVYQDQNNTYPAEAEIVINDPDSNTITVYRFILEKCTLTNGVLSDNKFHPDYPAWFAEDLSSVADFADLTTEELTAEFCSDNPITRAKAYRAVGEYHGLLNLDQYPSVYTRQEAEEHYRKYQVKIMTTANLLTEHARLMNKYYPDLKPAQLFVRQYQDNQEFVELANLAEEMKISLMGEQS